MPIRLPLRSAAVLTGELARTKIEPWRNTRDGNTGSPTIGELPFADQRAIGGQRKFRHLPFVSRQETVSDGFQRLLEHRELDAFGLDPAGREFARVQIVADGKRQAKVGHDPSASRHARGAVPGGPAMLPDAAPGCLDCPGSHSDRGSHNVESAADLRLRALRPHACALHRRSRGRGRRSQFPGRRQSAQHLRPHGRRAGVRRRGILKLRIHLALRRQPVPVRRHPGVCLAGVPAQLHLRQPQAHQDRPRTCRASASACRSTP